MPNSSSISCITRKKVSTPTSSGRTPKPWWNSKCAEAKREFNRSQRELRRNRSDPARLERFEEARRNLDRTIKDERRESWRQFAADLTPSVPTTKVWNTLRGMDGRSQASLPGVPLVEGGKTLVTDKQKAEATVKVYAGVSRLKVDRSRKTRVPGSSRTLEEENPLRR